MSWYSATLAFFILFVTTTGSVGAEEEFLHPVEVFKLQDVHQQDGHFAADSTIADGYYVYRHSIKLIDGQGEAVERAAY